MPSAAPPRIGARLRDARVERSLSIEETAWRTRMRPDVLRALEEDEFDAIGHQAFVKTHLASYARFLGVDPQTVVVEFESTVDEQPSSLEELERAAKEAKKPPRAKWVIAGAVSGVLFLGAAIAGMLGGQAERPGSDVVDVPSLGPAVVAEAARPPIISAAEAKVAVGFEVLSATEATVFIDGEKVFEGPLAAGTTRTFRARTMIDIMIADGGSVRLSHNGDRIGRAGQAGAVFRARYGPRGRIAD